MSRSIVLIATYKNGRITRRGLYDVKNYDQSPNPFRKHNMKALIRLFKESVGCRRVIGNVHITMNQSGSIQGLTKDLTILVPYKDLERYIKLYVMFFKVSYES